MAWAVFVTGQILDRRLTRGTVEALPDFRSNGLGYARGVVVYLPYGYGRDSLRRYPVLYMQDGQKVFARSPVPHPRLTWRADEVADSLVRSNEIVPIIIVAIDYGPRRSDEYLPTKVNGEGGEVSRYTDMVVNELIPMVNARFRTKTGPENTAVCGSSFGGIATLCMGLRRPDVFGAAGVCSASAWWDEEWTVKAVASLPSKPPLKVWLDVGTAEEITVPGVRHLRDALIKKGWRLDLDLRYAEQQGGRHDENAWHDRLPSILKFLFSPELTLGR